MSVPTIGAVLAAIQDVAGAVAGVRLAPDVPPEQLGGSGVFGLAFPATGRFEESTEGRAQGAHTLHLLIATPRANLRSDWARVIGLGDTVPLALLASGTLGGTVLGIDEIRYTMGEFEWGGQPVFGWRFEVDVLLTGSL